MSVISCILVIEAHLFKRIQRTLQVLRTVVEGRMSNQRTFAGDSPFDLFFSGRGSIRFEPTKEVDAASSRFRSGVTPGYR